MEENSPEKKARRVVDDCADCEVFRFFMDTDCLAFPELYRCYDKDHGGGKYV